jgi:hypothetical protein
MADTRDFLRRKLRMTTGGPHSFDQANAGSATANSILAAVLPSAVHQFMRDHKPRTETVADVVVTSMQTALSLAATLLPKGQPPQHLHKRSTPHPSPREEPRVSMDDPEAQVFKNDRRSSDSNKREPEDEAATPPQK